MISQVFPTRRLKTIAQVRPSNVDKLTRVGETVVGICNYVDVYKNDDITGDIEFMQGSATEAQIEAFSLQAGDILITKDSETPTDIAVPAFVMPSAAGVVSGYHLALVRPKSVNPRFLFWALQAKPVSDAFSVEAKGVTRFGLSTGAIGAVRVPYPSSAVQQEVAASLDAETTRIDALIRSKRRMLKLIQGRITARTHALVTQGLDGGAELAETGLGTAPLVPRHWQVMRLATLFRESGDCGDTSLPVLTISIAKGISDRELGDEDRDRMVNRSEDRSAYKIVRSGDLAYNMMRAWQGALGMASTDGTVSPAYVVARPKTPIDPGFFEALLRTPMMIEEMRRRSKGIIDFRRRLYWADAKNIRVQVPPLDEQVAIAAQIASEKRKLQSLHGAVERSIGALLSRRASLITNMTSGSASKQQSPPSNRALVAAEIVFRHRTVLRFGRVKLQKLLYLAEAHVGIGGLNGYYQREAAGPLDRGMLDDVEGELLSRDFYRKDGTDGGGITYGALSRSGQHVADLQAAIPDKVADLRALIDLVRDLDTRATEMVTTLYAVWNDDLIDGRQISDDAIVEGLLDDWHPEKRAKFTATDLHHWLAWMKRTGLTPRGYGPRTIETMPKDLFAGTGNQGKGERR